MTDCSRKMNDHSRKPRTIFHTLLVFRAPTTLSEALAERAHKRGVSVSALIRELLLAGLKGT